MILETRSGSRYHYDMRSNRINVADDSGMQEFIAPVVFDEVMPVSSLPNIDTFIIEFTQQCNMRCTYCCYGGSYSGNRTHSSKVMSEATLSSTIDFIKINRVKDRKLTVVLYGGEPFTRFSTVKSYISKLRIAFDEVDIVISTNGLLLADSLEWLISNEIFLNVSLDGMESLHDANRKDIKGDPTFRRVYANLKSIYEMDAEYFRTHVNILICVKRLEDLVVISKFWGSDNLLKRKAPYLISGISKCSFDDYELDEKNALMVLHKLMDYYSENRDNLFVKTYFFQIIDPIIDRNVFDLEPKLTPLACLPYNNRCFIDCDGNIGICEKTPDTFRIGSLESGWDFDVVQTAIESLANVKRSRCCTCEHLRFCQMCFTNHGFDDERWDADCEWQKKWGRISMTVALEMVEENLIESDDALKCSLRPIVEDDKASLYRLMSNPNVMRYLDGVQIPDSFEDFLGFFLLISEINANIAHLTLLAIVDEMSDLIGVVGIDDITDDVANLFFLLEDGHWGKGIMTAMLAEYLERDVPKDVKRIVAHINPDNKAALALMSKFETIEVDTSPYTF